MIPYDTIASWIHPVWHYSSSVYGPLWIDFSVLMARASANLTTPDQILVYRFDRQHCARAELRAGGGASTAFRPPRRCRGLPLYAWNPIGGLRVRRERSQRTL